MNPLLQSQQQLTTEVSPLEALMAKPVSSPKHRTKTPKSSKALTKEIKELRMEVARLTPFEAAYNRLIAQKESARNAYIQAAYVENLQYNENLQPYRQRPRMISVCAKCGSARCAYPRRMLIPEDQYNPSRESRDTNPWAIT